MSSPGSMTIASCVVSSPMTEQLHWRGPTGRISWIIKKLSAGAPLLARSVRKGWVPKAYFFVGGAGTGAGAAGFVAAGIPCSTDFEAFACRDAYTESVIELTIKMIADQVVALDKAVAAPRGPNAVWLPMPPKAAVMSPLLPLCSNTTMIRNKQTII